MNATLPWKYALICADDKPEYFKTKREADRALRRYRREAEKAWYGGFPLGPYFPWAAVVELKELSSWEMTEEEYHRRLEALEA